MISQFKNLLGNPCTSVKKLPSYNHNPQGDKKQFNSGGSKRSSGQMFKKYVKRPVLVAVVVGGATAWGFHKMYQRQRKFLPPNPHKIGRYDKRYIYPYTPEKHGVIHRHLSIALPGLLSMWEHVTTKLWSRQSQIDFIDFTDFEDEDYKWLRDSITCEEAISLARQGADLRLFKSPYRHDFIRVDKDITGLLHKLVTDLSVYPINKCLIEQVELCFRHIANSIEAVNAQSLVESSGFDAFAGDAIPQRRVSEETAIIIFLTAVLAHTIEKKQIPDLLKVNTLGFMAVLFDKYEGNPEVVSLIVKILANISVDRSSRQAIHDSGCLYILAEARKNKNIHLSFPALRALLNLDRKEDGAVLMTGLYQLYPEQNYDDTNIECDVIFIHGLLGSTFKTWRRQELSSIQDERRFLLTAKLEERLAELRESKDTNFLTVYDDSLTHYMEKLNMVSKSGIPRKYHKEIAHLAEEELKEYCEYWPKETSRPVAKDFYPHKANGIVSEDTLCWPKDWLPLDCPNVRIITTDFESFISRLWPSCPVEQAEVGLEQKANDIMEKLVAAGVGKRPIIFVGHSMGGLIGKYILVNSNASEEPTTKAIAEQTKAVFFYSTPHYGSTTGRRWLRTGGRLIGPTRELQEIAGAQEKFSELVTLQEKFSTIYDTYNYKMVNFSELKSSPGGYGFTIFLVPRYSSDMGHGENFAVYLDHLNICKPYCRHSFVYTKLVAILQELFPIGIPCEKVKPSIFLSKDSNHEDICSTLGLGKYGIVDPHLVKRYRGPQEVSEWERLNRESEKDEPPEPDDTQM